ncbi:MAG: hypothetical protein ACJ79K_03955 [Gemmatimonadaceae bacterium]
MTISFIGLLPAEVGSTAGYHHPARTVKQIVQKTQQTARVEALSGAILQKRDPSSAEITRPLMHAPASVGLRAFPDRGDFRPGRSLLIA